MNKLPQFLYVPRINTLSDDVVKLIVETRKNLVFQVFEFENYAKTVEFSQTNKQGYAVAINKKYPIAVVCIKNGETTENRLVKLTELACDWVVQFYLENQQLSKINKSNSKEYTAWAWSENYLTGQNSLINHEQCIVVFFNYDDIYNCSFEDFNNHLTNVQFINGKRPEEQKVKELMIEAFNFLGLCELKLDKENNI